MPKELMFPLEAQAFEKIEIGIKEILNNDLTLKQYNEILNKCIILERTVDLKNIITQFNLFETIIKPFQIKDDKIPIFSFKKSHFLGSLPTKALIYLSRKGLYEGEILDEVPHGTGTFTMKSVSYEGKFEKGALEGYGRYRSEIWDIMYDGKFSENIARHGILVIYSDQ